MVRSVSVVYAVAVGRHRRCGPSHRPPVVEPPGHRPSAGTRLTEERTLHTPPPRRAEDLPGYGAIPARDHGTGPTSTVHRGLQVFNRAPAATAHTWLLACCASRHWAERLVAHRPYPDPDALLAAADEASYDLAPAQLTAALAAERPHGPHPSGTPDAALTALHAAHTAYESRFGHVFVIALDRHRPGEHLDQTLAGLRARLGNEPEEERVVAADELRRVARARLSRLVAGIGGQTTECAVDPEKREKSRQFPDSGPADSPYVPVRSHLPTPRGRTDSWSIR